MLPSWMIERMAREQREEREERERARLWIETPAFEPPRGPSELPLPGSVVIEIEVA